jgi:hypothetical protein
MGSLCECKWRLDSQCGSLAFELHSGFTHKREQTRQSLGMRVYSGIRTPAAPNVGDKFGSSLHWRRREDLA